MLVILGLLVGGVLAGQNLIRAAELRNVLSEKQNYETAALAFREKYFAIPGDMDNATDFWGIAAGTTGSNSTCYNALQTTEATCNGDGNDLIESRNQSENVLFWKHLVNSGLLEGSYTGSFADGSNPSPYTNITNMVPGWNMPLSKLSGATWDAANYGSANVSLQKYHGAYTSDPATPYYYNSFYLIHTSLDAVTAEGGALSTDEAWGIDTKADDGLPGGGKIQSLRGNSGTSPGNAGDCLTTPDPSTSEYDLANTDANECPLVFVRVY